MCQNSAHSSIYAFPGPSTVSRGSLLDRYLTTLAKNPHIFPWTASSAFAHLPTHLKELLLSYVATHRVIRVTIRELRALLAETGHVGDFSACISTRVRHLDLSHSIGSSISCDELSRSFAFTSLTHLCLANPGPGISWSAFVAFAQNVPDLTHLSLAYWPLANTSPRDHSRWSATLRSLSCLSRSLTKLQYLDLEGCSDWITVLISGPVRAVDWVVGWKHVCRLNLSQGPMPIGVSLEGGPATEKWIQGEVSARQIGDAIDRIRRCLGSLDVPPIQVEHGWSPNNFMIKFLVDRAYERREPEGTSQAALMGAAEVSTGPLLEPHV
ncbi:MAG: hypothetical protein LQ339_004248 [Xanthoria mediterranea]|nr:MAG: hypothetical protein LQ339_004248 [Xanthoria mediterranea]